jgi:hypothetical protein
MTNAEKQETIVAIIPQTKGSSLVSVEEELKQYAVDASAQERPIGGSISLRAGQISWQGNPVPGNRLPCVVLNWVNESRWYTDSFNPDKPSQPACYSLGTNEADMVPHESSPNPQGGKTKTCADCPKNEWGSDPRGGRGKACSQIRRLALMPSTAIESDSSIQNSEIAILKLPVTSIRYWGAYVNRLSAVLRRPPFAVVTEVYTEPHPKHQFHVHFNPLANVPNERIEAVKQKREMAVSYLMAPYSTDNAAENAPGDAKQQNLKF